jgi:hypothetical protein
LYSALSSCLLSKLFNSTKSKEGAVIDDNGDCANGDKDGHDLECDSVMEPRHNESESAKSIDEDGFEALTPVMFKLHANKRVQIPKRRLRNLDERCSNEGPLLSVTAREELGRCQRFDETIRCIVPCFELS